MMPCWSDKVGWLITVYSIFVIYKLLGYVMYLSVIFSVVLSKSVLFWVTIKRAVRFVETNIPWLVGAIQPNMKLCIEFFRTTQRLQHWAFLADWTKRRACLEWIKQLQSVTILHAIVLNVVHTNLFLQPPISQVLKDQILIAHHCTWINTWVVRIGCKTDNSQLYIRESAETLAERYAIRTKDFFPLSSGGKHQQP